MASQVEENENLSPTYSSSSTPTSSSPLLSSSSTSSSTKYVPILRQYVTVGIISILLGNSVPSNYHQNPQSYVYVSMLIILLLSIWGSSLGKSELNFNHICVRHSQKGLKGHSCHITAIAISYNNPIKIVSASYDSTIRVWDFATSTPLLTYMEHQCRILCVVITSTDRVCSGGLNHLIHIWDLHSGETLRILSGHTLSVSSLSISNSSALCIPVSDWPFQNYSNSILASGGEDGKILIWNLASDELVCNFTHPVRNQTVAVVSLCLSKGQSTYLVSGGTCGTIALWKLSTQELIHTFEGHFGPVTSLVIYEYPNCSVEESFSRPSSVQDPLLISSSADWTIRIWNLTTTTVLNILEGHSGGVECLALYIPTQKRNYSSAYQSSEVKHSPLIVSGGRDETIRVWDLVSGALYRNLEDHSDTIYSLAVSTTDTKQMIISGITSMTIMNEMKPVIVSGGADCSLKLWNLDKIIADIHWDRRKNFGQFIYFLRHCGHIYFHANTSTSTANLEDLSQSVLEEDTSMNNSVVTAGRSTGDSVDRIYCMEYSSLINAFNMDDICYLIATYL